MKNFFVISFLFFSFLSYNQELPAFMLEIQKEKPNFFTVEKLYKEYAEEYAENNPKSIDLENQEHEEFKNPYEKQYIEWIRLNQQYINEQGFIIKPTSQEIQKEFNRNIRKARALTTTHASYNSTIPYHTTFDGWSYDGPIQVKTIGGINNDNHQANVRAFAQSKTNPNFLYSAVEGGPLFVSRDKGNTWHYGTLGYSRMNEISAIGISPINEYYAYAGNANGIFATKDGGVTWQLINDNTYNSNPVLNSGGIDGIGSSWDNAVTKIVVQNTNTNPEQDFVLISTKKGLFKITNNGTSYSFKKVVDLFVTDIIKKPGSSTIFYSLVYEKSTNHLYFYESTDSGDTWHKKGDKNGWYDPTTSIPIEKFQGGRLAVTDINPEVVYAYVIEGRQNKNDNYFLGVYKSSDSGSSWTLPNTNGPGEGTNGYDGINNRNLATFPPGRADNKYTQGFYNCAIMVSPYNENEIILGGLNIYKSIDGAKTWNSVGGYEGPFSLHADSQTFYYQKNNDNSLDVWITTDGGINYSNDFFNNTQNHQIKNRGLTSDYWGFDLGENTENYIGGTYHNGNKFNHEKYPKEISIRIGGGESSTGYILPQNNENSIYTIDVGGVIMSENHTIAPLSGKNISPVPFENYAGRDPVVYTIRDFNGNMYYYVNNEKEKTIELYQLSAKTGISAKIGTIITSDGIGYRYAVDYNDPKIQYFATYDQKLYFSNDLGKTWIQKTFPFPGSNISIVIDGQNPNKIYALNINSSTNPLKESLNNGTSWVNITTPNNGLTYRHILSLKNLSNSYMLFGRNNSRVFYKLNSNNWVEYSNTLPSDMNILEPIINYKTQNIFLATSGYGIWKNKLPQDIINLYNNSSIEIKIRSDVNKTNKPTFTFNVQNLTLTNGKNIVSKEWEFPGANNITGQNTDNPKITYNKFGRFPVTLKLKDDKGVTYSKTFPDFFVVFPACNCNFSNAISNNLNNITVWFDASDYKNGRLKDKLSAIEYALEPYKDILIETATEFNNQPVFKFKDASNSSIQLGKMYEGKTLFIVNNISKNTTADYSFLFGGTGDFHSEKSIIFSTRWISDSNRYNLSQGGLTQINGINKDFFTTAQRVAPSLYTIRTANGKNATKFDNISKDKSFNTRAWQGKIAEVLVFDKQLTDAEIQEINQYLIKKYDIKPDVLYDNMNNISVWFDASNYKDGKVYDKLSGVEYTIENSQDTTIETAPEFNNQLVFKFKDGANANIQLGKMYEGKTLFIVNSLSQNSTANFSFLFGGTGDFHSEKSTIFSPNWISDSNRYNLSQGGLTQINGINKDFFTTAQQVKPTLYTIRTANLKNAAQFNSISRDRTWNERSWQGKIAEVLIFDKQLTDAEVQEINKYLMNKYNIK